MPSARVEILRGKTAEYKELLLHSIQEALVNALHVEEDNRCLRLYELDADCFLRRAAKTDNYTLIELSLMPGRSKEIKRSLIKEISRLLFERLEIQAADVLVIIHEVPLDNWGFHGEQGSERG